MELEGNRDTFIGVEVTRTVLGKGPDFLTLGVLLPALWKNVKGFS